MSILQTRILANTFTTETAWHRFHACRHALETAVYAEAGEAGDLLARYREALQETDEETAEAIVTWGTDWVAPLTAETISGELTAFKTWLEHVPTFTLYVPVAMDLAGEAILGAWCREQLSAELLLELVVEPTTVGGCAFVRSGTYQDWSLAHRTEQSLPEVISTIVASYGE